MEQEDGDFLAGVGIYFESKNSGESYKFGDANAILKAELDGIRLATEAPIQEGETTRNIYTDSLNSLKLLQKMRVFPNKMLTHKYAPTLKMILLKASTLHSPNRQKIPVHMYKVAAHTGIKGNERANWLNLPAQMQRKLPKFRNSLKMSAKE